MPYWSDEFIRNMRLKESSQETSTATPSVAVAATPSSYMVEEQCQVDPFPLMQLPPEIRRLIYCEILRPDGRDYHDQMFDDCEPDTEFLRNRIDREERQAAVKDSKKRADFLIASKQVNAEASEVWYDMYPVKAAFWGGVTVNGSSSGYVNGFPRDAIALAPVYLPRIRELEIKLRTPILGSSRSGPDVAALKHFKQFCNELAAHCPGLKNLTVEVPCMCSMPKWEVNRFYAAKNPDRTRCLTAEELERVLKPLLRVRVSRKIEWKTSCKSATGHLKPVWDSIAAVVRSSAPVPELEGNDKVWWDLYEKSKPFLKDNDQLQQELYWLDLTADFAMWIEIWPPGTTGEYFTEDQAWGHLTRKFREDVQRIEDMIEYAASEAALQISADEELTPVEAKTAEAATGSKGKKRKAEGMTQDGSDDVGKSALRKQRVWLGDTGPREAPKVPKNLEINMNWCR